MHAIILFALWAALAESKPQYGAPLLHRQSGNSTGSPCAAVSASAASILAASPSATPTVPADLAYECITSVPLNVSAASALVDALPPYIDWQSTTAYLKNPPAEYATLIQPPNDVLGKLAQIAANISSGAFANGMSLPCFIRGELLIQFRIRVRLCLVFSLSNNTRRSLCIRARRRW